MGPGQDRGDGHRAGPRHPRGRAKSCVLALVAGGLFFPGEGRHSVPCSEPAPPHPTPPHPAWPSVSPALLWAPPLPVLPFSLVCWPQQTPYLAMATPHTGLCPSLRAWPEAEGSACPGVQVGRLFHTSPSLLSPFCAPDTTNCMEMMTGRLSKCGKNPSRSPGTLQPVTPTCSLLLAGCRPCHP